MKHQIAVVTLIAFSLALGAGCGSAPVEAPTSYETWNAKDGTFQLEYPEGWEAKGGGQRGIQWARINEGDAEIYVNVSTTDSLIGEIAGSPADVLGDALGEEPDPELSAARAVHDQNKDRVVEDAKYKEYQEEEIGTLFNPTLGEAYRTEFTAKKGMTKVKGIRASILGHDKGVTVVMHAKPKDYEKLKPAFIRILEGMKPGTRQ